MRAGSDFTCLSCDNFELETNAISQDTVSSQIAHIEYLFELIAPVMVCRNKDAKTVR